MADAIDRDIDKYLKTRKTPMSPEKEKRFRAEQRRLLLDEQKHLKNAKRWENTAKATETAENVLDVAGLFTGAGTLVSGAKILGKKLLKKGLKSGVEKGTKTGLTKPTTTKVVRDNQGTWVSPNSTKAAQTSNKVFRQPSSLKKKVGGAIGADMGYSELGNVTGVNLPDVGFTNTLLTPPTAKAPSRKRMDDVVTRPNMTAKR